MSDNHFSKTSRREFLKNIPIQIGGSYLALSLFNKVFAQFIPHAIWRKPTPSAFPPGGMFSFGYNNYGQLGDGSTTDFSSPVQIGALTTWSKLAAGYTHAASIKSDGTLWSWGYNDYGQVGDSSTTTRSSPVQVGALNTWSKVSCGGYHTLAIKTDGTLWGWGLNSQFHQVGDSTTTNRSSPVQIGALTTWAQVSAGTYHSLAIKTDGTLWGWGDNTYGQLGLFDNGYQQIGTLTNWAHVSLVGSGTLAVKTDGTVWCWGSNYGGYSSPVQIGSGVPYSIFSSAGQSFDLVLKNDNTIWTKGQNQYGQLGDGTTSTQNNFTQLGGDTWSTFSCGGYSVVAIKSDSTLWTWGYNSVGQLGDGTTTDKSSPIQVGSGNDWVRVSASFNGSVFGIKIDGTLWAWGDNSSATLGISNYTSQSSPVQVGALTDWSKVNAGDYHTLAIKTDGTLWAWGDNTYGQLGINNTTAQSSPVQVGSLTTWTQILTRGSFSVALKTDGTCWVWGDNSYGTLGSLRSNTSSPVQLGTDTNFSMLGEDSGYGNHAAAIKTDGTLWMWGSNTAGELGNNFQHRSSPVQIGALTTWSKVSGKGQTCMAIKTDGTLWAWGNNNSTLHFVDSVSEAQYIYSPVQVGALGSDCASVDVSNHALVVKNDGTLIAWGNNSNGELGQGDTNFTSSKVTIGAAVWSKASAGGNSCLAVKTDGTLWAWGLNDHGQLGDGTATDRSSPVQVGSETTWIDISVGTHFALTKKS